MLELLRDRELLIEFGGNLLSPHVNVVVHHDQVGLMKVLVANHSFDLVVHFINLSHDLLPVGQVLRLLQSLVFNFLLEEPHVLQSHILMRLNRLRDD